MGSAARSARRRARELSAQLVGGELDAAAGAGVAAWLGTAAGAGSVPSLARLSEARVGESIWPFAVSPCDCW
jgi:hypothetical protein